MSTLAAAVIGTVDGHSHIGIFERRVFEHERLRRQAGAALNRRTTSAWALLVALWVVLFAVLRLFPILSFETYVAAGVATAFTSIVYGVLLLGAKDGAPVALEKDLASKSPDAFRGLNRLAGLLFLLLGAAILFATFEQYAWVWVAIVGSGISFSVVTYLRLKYERDEGHNERTADRRPPVV